MSARPVPAAALLFAGLALASPSAAAGWEDAFTLRGLHAFALTVEVRSPEGAPRLPAEEFRAYLQERLAAAGIGLMNEREAKADRRWPVLGLVIDAPSEYDDFALSLALRVSQRVTLGNGEEFTAVTWEVRHTGLAGAPVIRRWADKALEEAVGAFLSDHSRANPGK